MNNEEIEALDLLVAAQKKVSLKKLFKLICKTEPANIEKLDKELAYMQIFGKKYTAENDYLWRNELRLLMELVEKYGADKMMKEELDSSNNIRSKYFLKYLLNKNLYSLLSAESEHIKEAAIKQYDYRTVVDVCEIINPYLGNFAWNDLSMQEKMASNSAEYKESAGREFLHTYRKTQIAITASKLFRYKEKFKIEQPEPGLDVYFAQYEDPYSQYLSLRLLTIGTPQTINPESYRVCLEHLMQYPDIPNHTREQFLLLTNLAGYYFFRHDYEEAFGYNRELVKLVKVLDPVYGIAAVYNYMSNLAHLGQYDEALACVKEYESLIRQFPNQSERFDYMVASSYALKGDRVAFNASLPRQFDEMSKMMQYHYRFLIALSHFLDKEYNLAISEVTNIERSLRGLKSDKLNYYDEIIIASEHLNEFFDLYQDYKLNGNTPKLKRKIEALQIKTQVFISDHPMTAGLLFYRWMVNEVYLMKERLT
ncbi:MAG: hypothetical protein JWO03_50 [Bacteroidetes bacterium]|nr:hypothetical protein [Bacteroidota bacterium]